MARKSARALTKGSVGHLKIFTPHVSTPAPLSNLFYTISGAIYEVGEEFLQLLGAELTSVLWTPRDDDEDDYDDDDLLPFYVVAGCARGGLQDRVGIFMGACFRIAPVW